MKQSDDYHEQWVKESVKHINRIEQALIKLDYAISGYYQKANFNFKSDQLGEYFSISFASKSYDANYVSPILELLDARKIKYDYYIPSLVDTKDYNCCFNPAVKFNANINDETIIFRIKQTNILPGKEALKSQFIEIMNKFVGKDIIVKDKLTTSNKSVKPITFSSEVKAQTYKYFERGNDSVQTIKKVELLPLKTKEKSVYYEKTFIKKERQYRIRDKVKAAIRRENPDNLTDSDLLNDLIIISKAIYKFLYNLIYNNIILFLVKDKELPHMKTISTIPTSCALTTPILSEEKVNFCNKVEKSKAKGLYR